MNKVILGIDYGTTNIGVAIARGPLAEPLEVVGNETKVQGDGEVSRKNRGLDRVVDLIKSNQVELIVMGMSEGQMAERIREFVDQLQEQIDIPVEYIDETLSSYEMHQKLRNSKRKKKQGPIDHFVAAELLQEYLG